MEFYTPAGLPSDMTKKGMDAGTTRGIYKLSLAAAKSNKYMEIASIKETTIHNGKLKIKNRNLLLGEEGIYGIKTGHHSKVGYNISVLSDKDNMKIFTVVVGGPTYKKRDESVLNQMEEFYEEYQFRKLTDKNVSIAKVPVFSGYKEYADLYPDKNFTDILYMKPSSDSKNTAEKFILFCGVTQFTLYIIVVLQLSHLRPVKHRSLFLRYEPLRHLPHRIRKSYRHRYVRCRVPSLLHQ